MDCAGLRADIDKLKNGLSALESDIEKIRKTEGCNKELQEVVKSIDSSSADQVLEKYLKDFQEQNLDILSVVTLGERIDITDANGNPANICSIETTKDGHVLVGGYDGVLYAGSYNEQGELELGERMDIRDVNEKPATIRTIATSSDGHVLIGGDKGVLYAGSYNDHGELELGKRIDVMGAGEYVSSIRSIVTTEDGRVLIGGLSGILYTGAFDISLETLKQHLPDIIKKGESSEQQGYDV